MDVLIHILIFFEYVLAGGKEHQSLIQQIVKVQRVVLFEFPLIPLVYSRDNLALGLAFETRSVLLCAHSHILCIGDMPSGFLFEVFIVLYIQ